MSAMNFLNKKNGNLVSPLMIIGVLAVLLPVFTIMTLDRMERQEEHIRDSLLARGMSLIRTFEAGTRTGMLTMEWGFQRIQSMLSETAVQPDISYIIITDGQGRILAHSDADRVGETFEGWAELGPLPDEPFQLSHRSRQLDGQPVFEVYKRFVPLRSGSNGRGRHGRHSGMERMMKFKFCEKDFDAGVFKRKDHFIFAGLSMKRVEKLKKRTTRQIIGRGILFFVLGCAGIISLLAFQAYRSAKASLDRVKAFSDNVVQNMPSGLVTLNLDYRISSANRAARKILGNIPETAWPPMIQLATELSGTRTAVTREVVLRPSGPNELRLDMTASSILDDNGRAQGFIFLFRDLTQFKELKKEVETNRRLAAIGKLAGGVAHEIRNPLSSIKGFATYFAKRYEDEVDDAETAKIMVQEVERINRSVTQLLEFAKPMAVVIKSVEIEPLLHHSLKLVSHDLDKKQIRSRVRLNTCHDTIFTDPDRINQVLLNLYMNAVNAMADHGKLEVAVADTQDNKGIEIRVQDTGCGIEAKDVESIFDPYFTTRPKGTGLGLSIVHRIVENLKGEIRVESEPGKGSCFILVLPLVENK